ncbi:MAG: glycosyltransferase [Planctomycetota bacterium]
MRIVHVDPERSCSGGEVQVFLLMEGLRERGHACSLACVPDGAPEREALERGFETFAIPMRSDLDLFAVPRLRRAIQTAQADLVHLHTGRANWLGGMAARLAGRPAISTRRMDRRVKRNWRTRWIYGSLVRRTAAISPAVERRLHDAGVPPDRTRLIWSSIDPAALAPAKSRESVRTELNVAPDEVLLLAAGALVPRKGLDVLLEALPRLSANVRLCIAGEGPEREVLEALAAASAVEGRVRLLGRREDLPDLLAACDLFVMPSRAEGLGIAALEAMAAGRAVVASRVGGLGELVLDGVTGRLVPPDDVDALSAALAALCADRGLRARYGEAGAGRIADGFRADQMVQAYEQLYREVLAEERER